MSGDIPLAYFLTWTCYGTWLHGRDPGSVDHEHNRYGDAFLPADAEQEAQRRHRLAEPPYSLDAARRAVVLRTLQEVSAHRQWRLIAAHARTNHVHLITPAACTPDKIMDDYKAYSSRRLKEAGFEPQRRHRWTESGSKRYLWKLEQLEAAVRYVLDEQGERMDVYEAPLLTEPDA